MRESNFAFPAQNRACVCISSQLYDRRALDTTSPLPLLNSLTHLTYLTSTSPRIREILTCDGGLERLVRLLRDFCLSPPPPENPSAIYGLSPPSLPRPPPIPTLNPKNFDTHAAYRFSLAFQCVVNIGVRGSEPIRSRVVEAGTLDVVGCVLEAWLASKGIAVGPAASASGLPRESREQRALRRQMQNEQRQINQQREQAQELMRILAMETRATASTEGYTVGDEAGDAAQEQGAAPASDSETAASTDTSTNATPIGTSTPTTTAVAPGRDRSGTIVARRTWDREQHTQQQTPHAHGFRARMRTRPARPSIPHMGSSFGESAATSASTSRPDTETEDDGEPDGYGDGDGDGDIEMGMSNGEGEEDENIPPRTRGTGAAGGAAIAQSDPLDAVDLGDSRIIINANDGDGVGVGVGVGGVGVGGLDDGLVALEQNVNDDLAMGAPPGAPGAIEGTPRVRANTITMGGHGHGHGHRERGGHDHGHGHHRHGQGREELTPRAVLAALPLPLTHAPMPMPVSMNVATGTAESSPSPSPGPANGPNTNTAAQQNAGLHSMAAGPTVGGVQFNLTNTALAAAGGAAAMTTNTGNPAADATGGAAARAHAHHAHRAHRHFGEREESGPFKEEDVLLSLQLLAYLSKYPHVRQAFYKKRLSFHPATAQLQFAGAGSGANSFYQMMNQQANASASSKTIRITDGGNPPVESPYNPRPLLFFKSFTGRGKEKASGQQQPSGSGPSASSSSSAHSASSLPPPASEPRMTNVFSLVERFTFRPAPEESELPSPPPFLPPEIQYWAGVIMRNACRKDESQGGIRQCANMLCGKWESYPREFAKCRRCRKAKYCGKECQSRAWSEGHRFWCSAREMDEAGAAGGSGAGANNNGNEENRPAIATEGGLGPTREEQIAAVEAGTNALVEDTARARAEVEAELQRQQEVHRQTRAMVQQIFERQQAEAGAGAGMGDASEVRQRVERRQARENQHRAVQQAAYMQLQALNPVPVPEPVARPGLVPAPAPPPPSPAYGSGLEEVQRANDAAAARYSREEQLALQHRAMLEASGLRPVGRSNALNPFASTANASSSTSNSQNLSQHQMQAQAQSQLQRAQHHYDAPSGSRVVPIINRRRPMHSTTVAASSSASASMDMWDERMSMTAGQMEQQRSVRAVPIEEAATVMPMETREDEDGNDDGDLGLGLSREREREWDAPSLRNRIRAMDVRDQMGFRPVEERRGGDDEEIEIEGDDMVIG